MGRKKQHKDSAERQRAYRQRKRNAIPSVTPPIRPAKGVTQCGKFTYLGNWGYGPQHLMDVNMPWCKPGTCELCDAYRPAVEARERPHGS